MPILSITRLRIRSWRSLPRFLWLNERTVRQLRRSSGLLSASLLADRHRVFWTMSLWESEAAMRGYRDTGVHREAMPKLVNWADESSVARIVDVAALPGWPEAHALLAANGRPARVRKPSPCHPTLQFPAPRPLIPPRPIAPAVRD